MTDSDSIKACLYYGSFLPMKTALGLPVQAVRALFARPDQGELLTAGMGPLTEICATWRPSPGAWWNGDGHCKVLYMHPGTRYADWP